VTATSSTTDADRAVRRGRPRNVALDTALLVAAQDLLIEIGYDRLSLEAVAARAGSGRPAIYRRWSNKAELVADAVAALRWDAPTPDTGALRGDLLRLADAWSSDDARRDAMLAGMLPVMGRDPELRGVVERAIGEPRWNAFREIVERAVRRGEVDVVPTRDLLGAVFPAMAFHRIAVVGRPMDTAYVERLIDQVLLPLLGIARTGPAAD
jgi:AcrR family transcriptional regulator